MSEFVLEQEIEGLLQVWMYGGGRQSCCIAALIKQGLLPRPDFALIADTGREKQSTLDYLKKVIQPAMDFEIIIVPKSKFATVDLWSGKDGETLLIPAYTNLSGEISKLPAFCSNEWKVRVCERYLRTRGITSHCSWIGFSLDEPKRYLKMKESQGDYVRFPLVDDVPCTAAQCVANVEQMGWPTPEHSSCWMCPNMRDVEWQKLTPFEFEQACQLDEQIRLRDANAFLHKTCKPLREVVFIQTNEQPRPCDSGVCFN